MIASLPGPENVYLSGCCSGNAPEYPFSFLTTTSVETLRSTLKDKQKQLLSFSVQINKIKKGGVHTYKKSGRQASWGRDMERCSLVQVGLSQASRAVAIVPMLKQHVRTADGQSRASGCAHSTAATQSTIVEVKVTYCKQVNVMISMESVLFLDGEPIILTAALSFKIG